jgi:electron transfer flavoprotein alpha subunit
VSAGVLVIAELDGAMPTAATAELVGLARRKLIVGGGQVTALVIGDGGAAAPALIARGADRVLRAGEPACADYESETWTDYAAQAAMLSTPALVLANHNTRGADLAPRLAFRLDGAVALGCVAVGMDGDVVRVTRPCYGGNAREVAALAAPPAVVTVRSGCGVALAPDAARTGEIVPLPPYAPQARRSRVVRRERPAGGAVALEDARVVVAGGRGLNGAEGFELLAALAGELGGAVGASRVPCDLGWCPHSMQIGLTGKTVAPDLYIAVGISGAGHHLAGCGGARSIVAINTDAGAPIFGRARFGLVGDYRALVPALARAVAAMKAAGAA